MARKRRRLSGRKRTISPEQQAKMQEGRRQAQIQRRRLAQIREHGLYQEMPVSETEKRLNSIRRKG